MKHLSCADNQHLSTFENLRILAPVLQGAASVYAFYCQKWTPRAPGPCSWHLVHGLNMLRNNMFKMKEEYIGIQFRHVQTSYPVLLQRKQCWDSGCEESDPRTSADLLWRSRRVSCCFPTSLSQFKSLMKKCKLVRLLCWLARSSYQTNQFTSELLVYMSCLHLSNLWLMKYFWSPNCGFLAWELRYSWHIVQTGADSYCVPHLAEIFGWRI